MKKLILIVSLLIVALGDYCRAEDLFFEAGEVKYKDYTFRDDLEICNGSGKFVSGKYEFLDEVDESPLGVEVALEQKEPGGEWMQTSHSYFLSQTEPIACYMFDRDKHGRPFEITLEVAQGYYDHKFHDMYKQVTEFRMKLINRNANPVIVRMKNLDSMANKGLLAKSKNADGTYRFIERPDLIGTRFSKTNRHWAAEVIFREVRTGINLGERVRDQGYVMSLEKL